MKTVFLLGLLAPSLALANGATVILLRGNAKTQTGKAVQLKDSIAPGTTITTEAKSFVKLLFADQTSMNVGPSSTLKIEPTRPGEASLVNLAAGQLRAKVNKDPLQGANGETRDKLVIKTKTAAMGIRGTDFNVSFNAANNLTALVTFEGNVAMTRLEPGQDAAQALQRGENVQSVGAGQYSGAAPDLAQVSVPVKISPAQLESLKSNDQFQGVGERSANKAEGFASPVPPGVDPKAFSSGADASLRATYGEAAAPPSAANRAGPPPEGYFNVSTGAYAPRAGGFVDLASGRYIPPPPGSSFDPNTGVFTPPKAMGEINPATGLYVPPKGVDLDPVKGFVPEAGASAPAPGAPGSAAQNLAAVMNYATSPTLAGVANTATPLFSVNATGPVAALPPPPPPPPPPGGAGSLPPPPERPGDVTCLECRYQNQVNVPTNSNVRFVITTQ